MKNKTSILLIIMILIFSLGVVGCGNKEANNTTNTPDVTSTLSLSTTRMQLEVDDFEYLYAGYNGEDQITFTVEDDSIISLTVEGDKAKITALKVGYTYIDVEVDGESKTCRVDVIAPEYTIELDRQSNSISVMVGTKHVVKAIVYKDNVELEAEVEWQVSGGNSTKTINGNEIEIEVNEAGEYTVTAKYLNKAIVEYKFTAVSSL